MTHAMVFTGYDQRGGGVKNKKSKGGASKEGGEEKEEAGPTMVAGSLGGGDTATLHLEAQIAKLQGKIEAGFNTGSNHDYLDEQDAQRDLKQCQERLAAMSVVGMGDKVDKWRVEIPGKGTWSCLTIGSQTTCTSKRRRRAKARREEACPVGICCTAWCAVCSGGGVYCARRCVPLCTAHCAAADAST